MDMLSPSLLFLSQQKMSLFQIMEVSIIALCALLISLFIRRKRTRKYLEQRCKLPTVFWRPRFFNYSYSTDNGSFTTSSSKMKSSTITNILPRMRRLDGPYGVYGTVYGISTKVVHVAHPVPAHLVLKQCKTKTPAYNHFKNFSGDGVFTADGDEWKNKRSSVIHCLLGKSVFDRIEMEANRAAHDFVQKIQKMKTKDDTIINIVPILQACTIRIIYRFLTFRDPEEEEFPSNGEQPTTTSSYRQAVQPYLDAVTQIRMIILAQSRSFWFLLPRIWYQLFSPMYREEENTMKPIRKFARQACHDAKVGSPLYMLQYRSSHSNITSVHTKTDHPDSSDKMDNISKDMLDEAITLLFAGQDTSAATLSWTCHLLSLHPDKQERLAEEIKTSFSSSSFASSSNAGDISKKMTSQMPYLNAVIKESMRLYPVAPFVVRKLDRDIPLPTNETPTNSDTKDTTIFSILPKDSFACIWIYGLHRNEQMWNNPHEFLPERWLQSEKGNNDEKIDAGIKEGAYMPFATGPRNCLGQSLGIVILRIMLTHILKQFKVVDPEYEEQIQELQKAPKKEKEKISMSLRRDMQAGFTVLPMGGVDVSLQIRH